MRCQTYAGGVVECERSGLCVGPRCSIPIGSVTGPVTRAPRLHAASRGVRAAASATRDCRGVPHVCFVFLSCYDICVSASVNAHARKIMSAMQHTRVHVVRVRARRACSSTLLWPRFVSRPRLLRPRMVLVIWARSHMCVERDAQQYSSNARRTARALPVLPLHGRAIDSRLPLRNWLRGLRLFRPRPEAQGEKSVRACVACL